MKKSNIALTLALALAALAAPFERAHADGDIASIMVVSDGAVSYPNSDSPLIAGEKVYVLMRMVNPDWDAASSHEWYWDSLLTVINPPALGLAIGAKRVYATYTDTGPDGHLSGKNDAFTDLFFEYTVQPGEIGLPVQLLRTDGVVAGVSGTAEFMVVNVNAGYKRFNLTSDAAGTPVASFKYKSDSTPWRLYADYPTWPSGSEIVQSYDILKKGAYIQTVYFDDDKYADAWRYVYQGMSEPVDGNTPQVVCAGAGTNSVVYVWSDDESKVQPVARAAHGTKASTIGGKTVLTVPIPASDDKTSIVYAPFDLEGVGAVGDTAVIYMSSTPSEMYTSVGTTVDKSAVSNVVKIVEAPPPTVHLCFNGDADNQEMAVACSTNYAASVGRLTARISPVSDKPVEVTFDAALSGTGDLAAIFDAKIIGISTNATGLAYTNRHNKVTIPANTSSVSINMYALGWTPETVTEGIVFSVKSVSSLDATVVAGSDAARLTVTKLDPVVTAPDKVTANSGTAKKFQITVDDCYMGEQKWGDGTSYKFEIVPDLADPDTKLTNGSFTVTHEGLGVFTLEPAFALTPGVIYDARVTVTSPSGAKGSADFALEIKQAKSVTATASSSTVSEGGTLTVSFEISEPYSADAWVFLVPVDDAARMVSTNGAPFTEGVLVEAGNTPAANSVEVTFVDGENKAVQFEAWLSSERDELKKIASYKKGMLRPTVTPGNVAPSLSSVFFNKKKVTGAAVAPVPRTAQISMRLNAYDVDADLDATNGVASLDGTFSDANRQFMTIWRFDDGYPDIVCYGNPTQTVSRAFTVETEVSVYLRDKDQKLSAVLAADPAKTFTVPVGDEPGVKIAFKSEYDTGIWEEDGVDDHALTVRLDPAPTTNLTVKLTVPKGAAADGGGFIKFQTYAGVSFAGEDDDAYYYNVDIGANQSSPVTLDIDDMDGTPATRAIYVTGVVTNATDSGFGKNWDEYYKQGRSSRINLKNLAPTIAVPTEEQASVTNMNVKVFSPFSVSFQIDSEVKADLASNVVATLTVDGDPVSTTNVTDTKKYTFPNQVEFTSGGLHFVTVVLTDKDDDSSERTLTYFVKPTKNLMVAAHGPGASRVSMNGHSVRYAKARGLGAGTVKASQNPQSVKSWVSTYAVSASDSGIDMTATGYTLANPKDNAINAFGNTRTGTDLAYDYTTDNGLGASGYDSFFYAWTCNNAKSSEGIELASDLLIAPAPSGEYEIPLQPYEEDKASYDNQYWEAVFSREWRTSDNLGDINADGVPDWFVSFYDFGVINRTTSTVLDGDDLESLADYNDDGDFYGATTNSEQKFTAPMEIRGLHDGLNYGMFPVTDEDGWVSDLDMSLAEKKALIRWAQADTADPLAAAMLATCTDPADDAVVETWLSDTADPSYATQQAAAKSYISSTWSGYVEGDVTTWGFTVENRTDPTKEDTDGDEMPDGYEYYWWYAATVGSKADGTGLMVGKRFNLSDIEHPTDILPDEISKIYNPNVKRNWTEQDTDNDGLLDVEERAIGTNPLHWDSDGDGLPDVYEVMWSIDPLKNENGVNGAMNADGDFMAVGKTDEYFTIYDIEGALYAVRRAVRLLVDDVEQPIPYMFMPGSTNVWTVVGLKVGEFDGGYIPLDHKVSSNIAHRLTVTTTNVITMVGINTVNLYHYQVYGYFGFDPRTGWFRHKSNDSLSNKNRWLSNGSAIGGARAVNTEPFTAIQEFKLLKYRYMLGLRDLKKDLNDLAAVPAKTTIAKILAGGCTNPNAVKDSWSWPFDYKSVEYPTTHGADTDKDGVPDGWELYVGVNPNIPFTDTTNESLYNAIRDDDRADGLALDVEYAGTDSCGVYEECESIFANHPSQEASANHLWFNKFFPTDPRSDDTDGDGINDGEERATWTRQYTFNRWGQTKSVARNAKHFSIYGTPKDLGTSRCIPGAGFNPCTIDTDSDALPDLWERQYAGILINGSSVADAEPYIVFKAGVPDSELYDDIRAALVAYGTPSNKEDNSGWYVIGGQDGTVSDAATALSLNANDLDWDADGLQNWQEYIVQAVRHFRYDDCKTPLMGFDIPAYNEATGKIEPGAWNGEDGYLRASYVEPFTEVELNTISNELNYVNFAAWAKDNPDYLGLLGYFADPPKKWDIAHLHLGWKYMMPPNLVHDQVFSGMEQLSWEDEGGTNHTLWVIAGDTSGTVITNGWPDYVYMQLVDGAESTYESMIDIDGSLWGLGTISVAVEPLEAMVTRNRAKIESANAYVGTDPRLWDTDADGMDDYWEMFHGLNPILGATSRPATEGVTNENTTVYYKDIIAEAYILSEVSANKNGWTGWDNESAPPYDPIRYPWMMGTGDCDADGDGLRNDEEGLYANTTSPGQLHTDPTPFWMTDFDAGVTNVPSINLVTVVVTNSLTGDPVYEFVGGVPQPKTASVVETNSVISLRLKPSYTALYYQNEFYNHLTLWQAWRDVSWCETLFSFEENEGYDTDNDWRSDSAERKNGVEPTSDPLDFSDPSRRQSLWLGGRGVAVSPTPAKRYADGVDLYRQFTVEAWARPEDPVSGEDQYVASRAVNYTGWDATHTNTVIRMNFAIGFDKDGHAFAEYENTTRSLCRIAADEALDASATNWVHLAATYDGSMLRLYVNGDFKKDIETTMAPATGVLEPQQDPQSISHFPYVAYYAMPSATIVGGRACGPGAFDVYAAAETGIDGVATNFFKGSVDEVRMWDGARSAAELKENYRKAFTTDEIKEMRSSTALKFMKGMRRNNNSGEASLPCELVQHYNFQTLAGATETNYVQKVPAGFANNMLANVTSPADGSVLTNAAEILWWKDVVENGNLGSVYDSKLVVPWIENTIAHLPMICGAMKDSFYWSENFAGFTPASFHGLSTFAIPNSMNPYNAVRITTADDYRQEQRYRNYVDEVKEDENDESAEAKTSVWYRYRYDIRIAFTATTDLLPLGDAYAKRLTDNWDGIGVDDAWATTTDGTKDDDDPDEDGIPGWAFDMGYTTAKAYRAALEDGLLPTGIDLNYRTYVGDADTNGNNIPDWWENHFGIMGCDPNEDLDNDGLSNYQEFFISFGNWSITTTQTMSLGNEIARNVGMPFLDPTNPHSGTNGEVVVDYFLKPDSNWTHDPRVVNGSYLGQMVTDHDFMESWWEHKNDISYSNAFVYDPQFDGDGDGWSNFSEARAYSWHGGYIASIIDRYFSANEDYHDVSYPVPAIGVRPTYYGMQNISGKGLVVRTMTSADKRVDATFAVPGSTRTGDAADAGSHFVGGYIGDAPLHGFLHPGRIMPSSDIIIYRRPVNDSNIYVWHVDDSLLKGGVGSYVDYRAAVLMYGSRVTLVAIHPAEYEFARAYSDTEGRMGEFVVSSTNAFGATEVKIGKIDYLTGEYSFNPDLARQIGVDPSECVYRIDYSYIIGDEWPQTLWLSETSTAKASGRVKEGKNTIEAFIDINANGAWDLGEPYGAVKDVDIGWHKTPEALTIELKDNPSIPARMALALGGANEGANAGGDGSSGGTAATASVLVRRVAINGTSENMPVRTLVTRSVASDDRAYLTEADLVSAARPDLDWAWLVGDAETMGIASIDSVTYSVETHETLPDGTATNSVLGIFTRAFGAIRRKPTALAPAYEAPVYTARPTFTFVSGDDTMTAYCVQISTNDTADGVIWESGARLLPGRAPYTVGVDAAYSVSPDFFVDTFATTNGSAFVASGTNYYWRVAVMNAKFKDLADDAWSDWMAFQMDVGNGNRKPDTQTGYGDAAVAVRYYGTGDVTGTNGVTNVVVEAYASADFTGVPLARVRLADVAGITNVADVATTNAVLRGLPSGDAYLLAYIDSNNDGKRQAYESWGYANRVGEDTKFIYTPVPVAIEDTMGKYPSVTIFIEDTDVNQNEMPDVLELDSAAWSTGEGVDADGDGLTDELEGDYGTDANLWDTDGDGMPDGWEALFANTDPTLADADGAVAGDVMAYVEVTRTVVTFDGDATTLFVVDGAAVPQVGDDATNCTYLTTYDYGSALGVGTNITAAAGTIASVETRSVALVHAQVYGEYGFNPLTANPTVAEGERVNTKEFTALDKYLVARYLEAYGVTNVSEVAMNTNGTWASYTLRPGTADTNGDGVADGWELYVMFGTNTTVSSVDDMKVSPFNTAAYVRNVANTPDAGKLSILDEFDRGNSPTDPWQKDTDGDGIEDKDAFRFRIKTAESQLGDDDNDGLSNWAEYLAWKLTGLDFDAGNACSVADNRLDYYFVVTNGPQKGWYVGECVDADGKGLIADHDFVEDRLETQYSELAPDGKLYANRYVWDALRDADGDGWSNWSEVRSGTRPTSVSGLDVDGNTDADYPQPVVALTVSYNGSDRFNAPIMVQAWSEKYAAGQPDAAWQIGESAGEEGEASSTQSGSTAAADAENTRYLGFNTGDVRTFYIGPGKVIPGSVSVKFKDPEWMLYRYAYGADGTPIFYGGEVHSLRDATWQGNVRDKADKNDPSMGKIYFSGTETDDPADSNVVERVVGSVNYSTGEVTLDFSVLNNTIYFSGSISSELTVSSGNEVSIVNMSESYVQIAWRSGKTEIGTHSTYFLGTPNATETVPSLGHLREGEATFIVFSDSDGNGVYTEGEPLGVVKHVKVGWDKVSDLVVELSETSRSADRFVVEAITNGVATTRIRVMRTAINGVDVTPRAIYARTIDFTSARLFTEADFIADGEFDFDWNRLVSDAEFLGGISADEIASVSYSVYIGDGEEPVRSFTRTFLGANLPPVATSTFESGGYLVRSARPSLQWTGAENGTAFALQIAEDKDFAKVVYATTNFMPAATEGGYAFKPDAYVGAELKDGTNYFWRVASLNAKFRDPVWSEAAEFRTAVDSSNADTGYGRLGLEVRYFGPATNALADVVVGVYESADFAGAPVARVRMSGTATVASLTNDLSKAFAEAVTNVVLDGIAPGRYFAMAFIDANTNGVRDAWETWGYVNKVDTESADLWTPVSTEVVSSKAALPTAFLVMEDTDANQNAIPDCLENAEVWDDFELSEDELRDTDLDGLTDVEETGSYGTDPFNPDTDGDGMPDGWEAVFAGTDPLAADADYVKGGDVMAYVEEAGTIVTVWDGTNVTTCVDYLLAPDAEKKPVNGDAASALDLFTAWEIGDGVVGYGTNVALSAGFVYEVADVTAAYVHSQVYEMFGFDPNTANGSVPAEQQVNTKPFTALDKYLVVRYLEACGVTNVDEVAMNTNRAWAAFTVKPGDVDNDRDGMPDGWELYTMFGPDAAGGLVTISPWDATDREGDPDGDGLVNAYEYDGGANPTDPWSADSDGDGVDDKASHDYFFKTVDGDEAGKTGYRGDADNDQLSNLIEYMIQGLTNFPDVVASKMSTFDETEGQLVPDYFLPHGLLYLGEMFTDHDMIEDWWEDEQPAETRVGAERVANYSRYSYDAASDSDGDGWSNWSEARLAIAGGKVTVTEFETNVVDGVEVIVTNEIEKAAYDMAGKPTPAIDFALRYNGDKTAISSTDRIVVMAWGPSKPTIAECDAAWTMSAGDLANGLMQVNLAEPEFGALREGENTFVAYVAGGTAEGGDSEEGSTEIPQFAVGKPYGVATGVRVSYLRGTPFTLELTHVDPTMARVNLPEAIGIQKTFAETLAAKDEEWWDSWLLNGSDQWREYYDTMHQAYLSMKESCSDRGAGKWGWATVQRSIDYIGTNMTFAASNAVHVWIVQVLMNGEKASNGAYYKRLMSLGYVDLERHPVLTEADVLTAVEKTGAFDLGWGTVTNDFVAGGHPDGYDLASASFALILESPPAPSYHISNNLLALEVVNHYDLGLFQDDTTNKTVVTVGSQPTFCWQHVSKIGKPYPAFQLKVWKKDGTTLVYDSGVQRAPARDADGVYRWMAPLWTGSITPQGVVFEADEDYVWDVSMLDAKFPTFNGSVAKGAALRVSDTSGDALLSDYGSIAVAVKYMGPGAVSTNGMRHVVRVEAYASPDFSGLPVAAGYVMNTNTMAATDKIALNALVKGLPKGGEYYVLAYLDSNGDGVRQAWESWGYGCYVGDPDRRDVYTPRAYGVATDAAGDLVTPTCVVYLEDADTNGNKLPDSLEVDATTGEFTGTNVTAASSPYVVTVGTNGVIAATNIFAAIEKDIVALPYYSTLVEMENGGSMASASLALAMSGVNLAALSVEPKVTITDFEPTVGISVEIDPGAKIDHDSLLVSAVTISVELEVAVEYTTSLAAAWETINTSKVTLSSISGVTSFAATDPAMSGINSAIKTTATSYPSAFFRIKEVKAVHK